MYGPTEREELETDIKRLQKEIVELKTGHRVCEENMDAEIERWQGLFETVNADNERLRARRDDDAKKLMGLVMELERLRKVNTKLTEELEEAKQLPLPETHVLLAEHNNRLTAEVERLRAKAQTVVDVARQLGGMGAQVAVGDLMVAVAELGQALEGSE